MVPGGKLQRAGAGAQARITGLSPALWGARVHGWIPELPAGLPPGACLWPFIPACPSRHWGWVSAPVKGRAQVILGLALCLQGSTVAWALASPRCGA